MQPAAAAAVAVAVEEEEVKMEVEEEEEEKKEEEEESLSGATELDEVRALLKEWLASGDDPQPEDGDAVRRFLAALVAGRQLHKVRPVLLFLDRYILVTSD